MFYRLYYIPFLCIRWMTLRMLSRQPPIIDSTSFTATVEHQHAPATWLDTLTWWIFSEPHLLSDQTRDMTFPWFGMVPWLILSIVTRSYAYALEWWGVWWPEGADRPYLHELVPEHRGLPGFANIIALLEFAVNNMDCLDVLHPTGNEGFFEIKTEFMDSYKQRSHPMETHGGRILLQLVGGDAPYLSVSSIVHRGTTYHRDKVPDEFARRVLWGLLAQMTIGVSMYTIQYQTGAAQSALSNQILPTSHPLRQVLMPTEMGTVAILGRGIPSLLGRRGTFACAFPYTTDKGGLGRLIHDYVTWDPLDQEDTRTYLMGEAGASELPVVGDYIRWWAYIISHMERVVGALYPNADDLQRDRMATKWIRESSSLRGYKYGTDDLARLPTLLAITFFAQIRHNFVSTATIDHIFRWYYILNPGPTSVGHVSQVLLTGSCTTLPWVPARDHRFDLVVDNLEVQGVMTEFYNGFDIGGAFGRSMRHRAAAPCALALMRRR